MRNKKTALDSMALVAKLRTELGMWWLKIREKVTRNFAPILLKPQLTCCNIEDASNFFGNTQQLAYLGWVMLSTMGDKCKICEKDDWVFATHFFTNSTENTFSF